MPLQMQPAFFCLALKLLDFSIFRREYLDGFLWNDCLETTELMIFLQPIKEKKKEVKRWKFQFLHVRNVFKVINGRQSLSSPCSWETKY